MSIVAETKGLTGMLYRLKEVLAGEEKSINQYSLNLGWFEICIAIMTLCA